MYPQFCQFLRRASHDWRAKHSHKRNILQWIIAHLQIIQNRNNLKRREISCPGRTVHRNPLRCQHFPESFCPAISSPQQDYNIPVLYRPILSRFFVYDLLFSHNLLNPLSNRQRLQFLGILILQLHLTTLRTCIRRLLHISQFFSVFLDQKYFCFYKLF